MKCFGASDPGLSRSNNEDAWTVHLPLRVAVLADGMGGENCGEVASAITIASIVEYLQAPEAGLSDEEMVKEAIRAANRNVIAKAEKQAECDGMGSTVVVVLWCGVRAVVANVGGCDGTHSPGPFRVEHRPGATRGAVSENTSYMFRFRQVGSVTVAGLKEDGADPVRVAMPEAVSSELYQTTRLVGMVQ